MAAIQFSVIDLACESADQSFFPPKVTMTTKSTTQIATVLGFPEYPGFTSTPPKRYKTLTWEGTSEQQLWFPANTLGNPGAEYQVAGARFDYAGSSTIDSQGNYTSLYTKNLSTMCSATGGLITTLVTAPSGGLENYVFVGWFGPNSNQKCTPPGIPYSFVANEAVGKGDLAISDSSSFWGSKAVALSGSKVSDFNPISSTFGLCLDSGGDQNTNAIIALFEPVPQGVVPPIDGAGQGTVWFFGGIVWAHDYSATLSDEYTDAEALTNAQVILGNGATAQNHPRTTGFVSTFTNVVYTLSISNLIPGSNYTVTVDIWNPGTGVTVPKTYSVSPVGTTQTIIDTVPVPPVGQSLQVRNPRIVFA